MRHRVISAVIFLSFVAVALYGLSVVEARHICKIKGGALLRHSAWSYECVLPIKKGNI